VKRSSFSSRWERKVRKVKRNPDHTVRLAQCLGHGVDWKNRTIYIVGPLPEEKAYQYIPALRLLDETRGDIKVVIMSPGGEESGGFALFDTIRSLRNKVITIGFGGIYSIAALVFQAGDTRLLAPNAQLMMHNGSISLEGGDLNTDMVQQMAKEATQNNRRYHAAIAVRCELDLQKVEEWCRQEKYFLSGEAIKEGLADGLVGSWKDV